MTDNRKPRRTMIYSRRPQVAPTSGSKFWALNRVSTSAGMDGPKAIWLPTATERKKSVQMAIALACRQAWCGHSVPAQATELAL